MLLWRVKMLGRFELSHSGQRVERLRSAKSGALLARLLCFPRVMQPREVLIDSLWPDVDLTTGRNRLKQELATLRRILEPAGTLTGSFLVSDRAVISLRAGAIASDIGEFESLIARVRHSRARNEQAVWLAQAIDLYAGELLPGYYDEWIILERERLAALYEWAQQSLAELRPPGNGSIPAGTTFEAAAFSVRLPISQIPVEERPAGAFAPLPMPFTRLWGREADIERLCHFLAPSAPAGKAEPFGRLTTLTGPGGSGKTRLALAVARRIASEYGGEVAWVSLADVSDPTRIPDALLDSLCLPRAANHAPLEQITERLGRGPVLLVLDNFEHLLPDGGADVVRALRERVAGLTLLVTSRQRLYLEGEREFAVPPLPIPNGEETVDELLAFASVQLFMERARATRPDFPLNARNAHAVAALCRDLDGLPLALELAASRANVLSAAQMHTQLARRFEFLVSKRRDIAPRHRSLRAALTWSYDLLPPDLRVFFCRLSVFRGGFTLEAAQQVCAFSSETVLPNDSAMTLEAARAGTNPRAGIGEADVLDALETLQAGSLLRVEEPQDGGQEARYHLLETLREFGQDSLTPEQADALAHRHRAYFLTFAQQAHNDIDGTNTEAGLAHLTAEHDNCRAALTSAQQHDVNTGLRLIMALSKFWDARGYLTEARRVMEAMLNVEGANPSFCTSVLSEARDFALAQGDDAAALAYSERQVTLYQLTENVSAAVLYATGTLAWQKGDTVAAKEYLTRYLHLMKADEQSASCAHVLNELGRISLKDSEYREALAYFEQAAIRWRLVQHEAGYSTSLYYIGRIYHELERYVEAMETLHKSLAIRRNLGLIPGIAYTLYLLGKTHVSLNQKQLAHKCFTEALLLFHQMDNTDYIEDTQERLANLANEQSSLDDDNTENDG